MKRYNFITFCIAVVCFSAHPMSSHAQSAVVVKAQAGKPQLTVNGKSFILTAPVRVQNGAHVIRLKKELFTALGIRYMEWDKGNTIYVQLSHGAHKIVLEIQKGRKEIKVKSGGSYVSVSPMPVLEYPRVFVPLEPLYEQLGFSVSGAPQTIVQKTKQEKKKAAPVKQKETESTKMPETPVTQTETQTEKTPEPVVTESQPQPSPETPSTKIPQVKQPAEVQPEKTPETITAQTPGETTPAPSTLAKTKKERFHVDAGYSLLAPAHVKFSNGGLEGRLSFALPHIPDASVTLSYASHTWTSVYPSTGQEADLRANIFTANLNYSLKKLYRASRPWLNAWHVTGGYAQFSATYEPNVTLGLGSTKQKFSGYNIGMGVTLWKIFSVEYRYFVFPKVSLGFRSLDARYAEQFTFSLTPLSF